MRDNYATWENRRQPRDRKKFEGTRVKGLNTQDKTSVVPIVSGTPIGRSCRPQTTPFNPFVVNAEKIEVVSNPRRPSRKERPTSPRGTSLSGTQLTSRLRASTTIAKTMKFVKGDARHSRQGKL